VAYAGKNATLFSAGRIRLLNEERSLTDARVWNDRSASKLWLYQLHYFEDLNARGAGARADWHRELIERWVRENPRGHGV
jgi:hypothetical protein